MSVPTFLHFFLLFLGCFLWPLSLFSSSHLFPPVCTEKEVVPGGFVSRVRFNSLLLLVEQLLGDKGSSRTPHGGGDFFKVLSYIVMMYATFAFILCWKHLFLSECSWKMFLVFYFWFTAVRSWEHFFTGYSSTVLKWFSVNTEKGMEHYQDLGLQWSITWTLPFPAQLTIGQVMRDSVKFREAGDSASLTVTSGSPMLHDGLFWTWSYVVATSYLWEKEFGFQFHGSFLIDSSYISFCLSFCLIWAGCI